MKDLDLEFKNKNEQLLRDKLCLDLDNNKDSLFQALSNFYRQRFIEAKNNMLSIYKDANKDIDLSLIDNVLFSYGRVIQNESKKVLIEEFMHLKECTKLVKFDNKSIKNYTLEVEITFEKYVESLKKELDKIIDSEIEKAIDKLNTKEDLVILNNRIEYLFKHSLPNSIIKKTDEYIQDRKMAIINNAKESYRRIKNTYKLTNKKVVDN